MEKEYVLITDTNSDLSLEFLDNNGIPAILMPFHIDDNTYTNRDVTPLEFYDLLRNGKMPTTTQFNTLEAFEFMEPFVQQGKDILYACFTSGLSGTFGSCSLAAKQLEEKYPGSRVYVLDTLCASMGQGLLVYKLFQMRKAGKSMDELITWAEENKLKIAHYIMVEDLSHLHRGGRVSKTSAVIGSMLGIKPILYVSDEGKLVNIDKIRGRKQAMEGLVDRMEKAVGNAPNDIAFVSHSDCREDAEYVAKLVKERFGVENTMINYIGPAVGSHTGIGTVALFMMAEHR